ncbi:MAG: DUF2877 domain-containing protein, partial [Treponema sp.]|nr:DUF2877 domain-containing protein [Treponema sp.]
MIINAVNTGKKWLPYCKAKKELVFTVHSVFNRVINISTGKELLSVAAEDIGCSSSFLTVPGCRLNFGAEAGQKCFVKAGCLYLTGCEINFNNAAVWKGPISKNYRYKKINRENIAAFKAVVDRKAAPESAWRQICSGSPCQKPDKWHGLGVIKTLRENPLAASKLIGLGPGLTPSGDDMLLGFLAMANHAPGNRVFARLLHEAVKGSLGKTADISAQALANALNCEYHEYIQNCLRDLCENGKEEVFISAADLLKIGATSGADIA